MGLEISNLSKSFGENTIIKDFDLSMDASEITIIVGASGSGKTTFLRMMNHLEEVDQGSIKIDGHYLVKDGQYQDQNLIKEYQHSIGLVFQDYQLFPNLSVLDNLLLAPQSNKMGTEEELILKAHSLLDQMELIGKDDVKPSQLSGGQKQRVAIARAMMMNPSILCFDEPTSALDDKTVDKVAELIKKLAQQGMMILIITHDMELVRRMGGKAKVIQSSEFISAG